MKDDRDPMIILLTRGIFAVPGFSFWRFLFGGLLWLTIIVGGFLLLPAL